MRRQTGAVVDTRSRRHLIGTGGTVRTAALRPLPGLLRDAGVDPAAVLVSVGLAPDALEDPDGIVPFRTACRLLAGCCELTGLQDLGLRVGSTAQVDALGAAGLLVRHSPTVGLALRNLIAHLYTQGRGAVPWLSIEGSTVSLGYEITEPGIAAAEQVQDVALALGLNVLRSLCGPDFTPIEVTLARRAPADPGPYLSHFGCLPRFDAPLNTVSFHAGWLDRPVPGADPVMRAAYEARVAALEAEDRRTLLQRTRAAVRTAIVHRTCTAARVCRVLSIPYRTLHRRLADEGTTFRELVDSVRMDAAEKLLVQTGLSLAEVADALDYSDPSAFTRAFVRCRGTTPSAWRARARQREDPTERPARDAVQAQAQAQQPGTTPPPPTRRSTNATPARMR